MTSYIDTCSKTARRVGCWGIVTGLGVGFVAYSATHLYMCFCAPKGVWGFVQSLVIMDSVFCQIIMAMIQHSQGIYKTLLVAGFFSLLGAMGKVIAWMTDSEEMEVPTEIQGPVLRRRTRSTSSTAQQVNTQ